MRSQIVRLTLAELDLKFNRVPVDSEDKMTNHEEWYAKMNREMTVPTLKYNDEILTETSQIIEFLNHNHPSKELVPDDLNRSKVEAYVNDVFSNFGAISKFTEGILHKQRLFGLYEQTHPKTMKIKQLR